KQPARECPGDPELLPGAAVPRFRTDSAGMIFGMMAFAFPPGTGRRDTPSGRFGMRVVIRLTKREEAKARPILLRHTPGMGLPGRNYVLSAEAARQLGEGGVKFTELGNEANSPGTEGVGGGERI